MELETVKLINTLMSLRKIKPADLAKTTNVSKASLSKFLNQKSDLRAEALIKILSALGTDFDTIMMSEINNALGQGKEQSIGEDIRFLLENADPITRKTITDTLITSFKSAKNPEIKSRVQRVKRFRETIKTVRRIPC
jgi:transcriptional regulator with XRE-family HTH domain